MTLSDDILAKLRPWQREPANRLLGLLSNGIPALDASDTGTGKTYTACAVAATLKRPTLAIVPKIAVSVWERAAEYMGEPMSVIGYEKLRTGRTPFGRWDRVPPTEFGGRGETLVCETCQQVVDLVKYNPCYCHPQGIHCVKVKKKPWDYGKFTFAPEIEQLIFDEVHRCNGKDSLNADVLIAAKRQGIPTLGLSATAACTPLQMNALGYLLGLHTGGHDFYRWAARYGCRKDPVFHGWKWMVSASKQAGIMTEINSKIFPEHGVRLRTADIPGFPDREIIPELYDLEKAGQIDKLYAEMSESLEALKKRSEMDKAPDHPLTLMLRAQQKIELLKVPLAVELASDYAAKGYSVALFVNFSQTVAELRRRLKCDCFIDGSPEGVRGRSQSIDLFQRNASNKIVVNSAAGGVAVSLHDLDGEHPRVGLVMPTFSATVFRQLLGRLHRDGGKSLALYRVLLAAKTIETKIYRALTAKLDNLDALNDSDLNPVCVGS